jgi:hypothetical protein
MITGLWANTNLDDGKQTRRNSLEQIEEDHKNLINLIYSGEEEKEIDYSKSSDPLFSRMKLDDDPVPTTETEDVDIDQE